MWRAKLATPSVQAHFRKTVALVSLLASCSTQTRDKPTAPNVTWEPGAAASSQASAQPSPPPGAAPPATPDVEHTESALPESATGSAYFGCGAPVPAERLWDETTESQVLEAISVAKKCAAEHDRRLLLEFVAPWCGDCREMAKVEATPLVEQVLRTRFERVRINVGKWDRHEGLRRTYQVKALATYVVIDPKTSKELAKTTLEPVTGKHKGRLTAEAWATWLEQH